MPELNNYHDSSTVEKKWCKVIVLRGDFDLNNEELNNQKDAYTEGNNIHGETNKHDTKAQTQSNKSSYQKLKTFKEGDFRAACVPNTVAELHSIGCSVVIQKDLGMEAGFHNLAYQIAGAHVIEKKNITHLTVLKKCHVQCEIHLSELKKCNMQCDVRFTAVEKNELHDEMVFIYLCVFAPKANLLRENSFVICEKYDSENLANYNKKNIIVFCLANIPRITKTQPMDILSSQSNIAGYAAVVEAAHLYKGIFPMITGATGTIPPAKVFVIGAGVAGLQAIATARRLGAQVTAFDIRESAREEIKSLGAKLLQIPETKESKTTAKIDNKMTVANSDKNDLAIAMEAINSNIVICSALGRSSKAPVVLHSDTLGKMKSGSIVIDLAVSQGGNCEGSVNGVIKIGDVTVAGYTNILNTKAHEASKLYSKNFANFLEYFIKTADIENQHSSTNSQSIITKLSSIKALCITDQVLKEMIVQ
jgi:NAD(P) transhydrogenase subunit alpha